MKKTLLQPIGSELDAFLGEDEITRNRSGLAEREAAIAEKHAVVRSGWGPKYADRVHQKGKLTTWERIEHMKDAGSEVFEVGTLVNWGVDFEGSKIPAPGAGVVTAFARIEGRWCMVIANDNTVASGAWWPRTPEKIERAQEMALRMRLPVVYLVDCSGLFLPEQSRSFSGLTGAGHIFTKNARLADAGVPQIAGVFGDCIAGGGYMPIISDRVVMTENAYMVIAGAALIRGAKSLKLTSLDIGGPEVHVHQSQCADVRVPDDSTALAVLRAEVARLPSSAVGFYRYGAHASSPRFEPDTLMGVFPKDPRQGYAIEEVLARLVDDSLFHEVLPGLGREMITGVARICGLWMGFIANRQGLVDEPGIGKRPGGALYREGIAKISAFARACGDDGIPIVWLQDISGFDIGVEAEHLGLLGYGGNLIYTNATQAVPFFTVLLRKASGAGYYAMSGMPYEPVVQLSTAMTRLAVMEGRTLAIAAFNSKLDDDFEIATTDPEERKAIEEGMRSTAARIEADMDPVKAASRMDTDEVVEVARLRGWLEVLAECAWQGAGYRRTKNPRIWSLHDLAVLGRASTPTANLEARERDGSLESPSVGYFRALGPAGSPLVAGAAFGVLERAGQQVAVLVPSGTAGVLASPASGWVEAGTALCRVGQGGAVGEGLAVQASEAGVPEGVRVLRAETDGTFYTRPEPGSPTFVEPGTAVKARDTLALVEVMKTFSPIRADRDGVVEKVLVADGGSVETGQPLIWMRES
ncbi:MAG: carboxyl transferase domain-containing protein [Myxococcota bacterium]